jgi:hypothetical protein
MTRENFENLFRGFSQRKPWRPYTVELINGSRIEINHPEALSQTGEILKCRSTTGLVCYFDCASVVRFLDATGTA